MSGEPSVVWIEFGKATRDATHRFTTCGTNWLVPMVPDRDHTWIVEASGQDLRWWTAPDLR